MRVLHVIPAVGSVYGGPSRLIPELVQALGQAGLRADIVTTDANGDTRLDVPLGVPVRESGVTTYYFPRQPPLRYTFSWPKTRWLWQHIQEYDLIHITGVFSYSTLCTGRLASWLERPFIVAPHGMLQPWCLSYKGWKKRPYLELAERGTLMRAAAIHALTTEEARSIRALGVTTPIFALPNGLDLTEFERPPSRQVLYIRHPELQGRKVILFLARIDPKKGLDLLIEGFNRAVRNGQVEESTCLVIAGPDLVGYRRAIESLIGDLGVRDRVVFTGMLSGQMKQAALAAADVFVLPSRSEGFSIGVLEALAAGCPVVITEECNFQTVAEAGAGKVVPATSEAIARALAEVLSDETLRREMGKRAVSLVQHEFAWPGIVQRMIRVYEDVLRGTRRAEAWVA